MQPINRSDYIWTHLEAHPEWKELTVGEIATRIFGKGYSSVDGERTNIYSSVRDCVKRWKVGKEYQKPRGKFVPVRWKEGGFVVERELDDTFHYVQVCMPWADDSDCSVYVTRISEAVKFDRMKAMEVIENEQHDWPHAVFRLHWKPGMTLEKKTTGKIAKPMGTAGRRWHGLGSNSPDSYDTPDHTDN